MGVADHWAKEQLHVAAMVRYMDDVLLFAHDRRELLRQVKAFAEYINTELRMEMHEPIINQTKYGIPFLGYVVYRDRLRLTQRSCRRYRRKMQKLAQEMDSGSIDEREYAQRATCLVAFVNKADSSGYRHYLQKMKTGIYPQGL